MIDTSKMRLTPVGEAVKRTPVVATVVGQPGVGKTTLAAAMPKPVIMRVEDGVQAVRDMDDVQVTPVIKDSGDVRDWIEYLFLGDHDRETLVVDSVSALDAMLERELVKQTKKKSIMQAFGGYGAGLRVLAARHQEIRGACGDLTRKGIHVVFVAHYDVVEFKPEDDESYSLATLKMNKKSIAPYVDDVDVVAFLRLKRNVDKKRGVAASSGRRELIVHANAQSVAKNRFGIQAAIPVKIGENPLLDVFKGKGPKKPSPDESGGDLDF